MSGTIPLSMTQQFDIYGKPLSGGQLYIMQAGTVSTPQDAFQDTALAIKQPYPMTLDAAGRVPQFFLADGTVKVRLQDKAGVVQLAADSVLVIGPSGGSGGGAAVDPTQLIQTGNMIMRYGVGALGGYVRLNSLTIGSATSGATERANADCQNLFQYLWNVDSHLAISGGRGATAAADWTANKQLALPDWRGTVAAGMDDMGAGPAGRLTPGFFGDATQLGVGGGVQYHVLTVAEMPQHDHVAVIYELPHHHGLVAGNFGAATQGVQGGGTYAVHFGDNANLATGDASTGVRVNSDHGLDRTNYAGGSGNFGLVQPTRVCTFYIKL